MDNSNTTATIYQAALMTNISSLELLDNLLRKGVKVTDIARQFKVNRSVVYQSINGRGSREIRVHIAVLLNLKPSQIWLSNHPRVSLLDDAVYSYSKDDANEQA
jgi:hypothetical protein